MIENKGIDQLTTQHRLESVDGMCSRVQAQAFGTCHDSAFSSKPAY
jgi:hypothetical protein